MRALDSATHLLPNTRMKTTSLDRELRARIDAFAADLTAIIRRSTLDALQSVIGDAQVQRATAAAPVAPASKPMRKAKRGTRSPEEVLEVAATFLTYVKSHPGERLDQIAKGLGVPTKDLKLPVQKLFAQKAIKTTGIQRGTKYFAK